MNYQFEEMSITDYKEILLLWKNTPGIGVSQADTKENIAKFLKRNPELSYVCKYKGKIIGTIHCGQDGRRGYIYHTLVAQNHQNNGIGKKLVFLSLKQLKLQGIDKCHLFVFADNDPGKSFWEKIGWKRRDDLIMFSHIIS